ncbi:spore gernimation protein GerC [Paenibacillus sp. 32O-W]|uniref:Ger(x)C family spore germination protein n=1 Tax=Paenibacillus sp. 32O-W TaxID=1695218 RepID=UPI0007206B71|nr:Ger(x)C family spore germination protein [Paenibacillus sp. 32O-W]ALS26617.1 spore gernimation protein GerC [Paenibacillus sp. 32O-W]
MGRTIRKLSAKPLFALLLVVPLATGCWDRLEIEERAVVLGISVDVAEPVAREKEDEVSHLGAYPPPKMDMIKVAAQIALPGRIPLGPGEGGGANNDPGKAVWVVNVVGHTIDDAIMNLQQQISGRLFFGHLRVIVVSEEVAKKGIQNLNDYLRRNSEVRRMAWLMISKGKAENLIKATPRLERVPTLYLISTLDDAVKQGKFPRDYTGMFWSNVSKKGQEGFLPYVEMMKEQNIEIKGMALFRGDKMVGATKPFEIAAYMLIKGLNPAGYRGMVRLTDSEDTVTINATHRASNIGLEIRNGHPHFRITAFSEINVEEKTSEAVTVATTDVLERIANENAQSLQKICEQLIRKSQKYGADIFGFGEYVRAYQPQYWNRHVRTKEKWQQMYKDVTFEVRMSSFVRRIGMKAE